MVLGKQNNKTRGKSPFDALHRHPWLSVTLMVLAIALLSALSNLQLHGELETAPADMSQGLYIYHVIRRIISMVLNTGTLWAGQLILAGWMTNRKPWWQWGIAGAYAGFLSLTVHYLIYIALSSLPFFVTISFQIFSENIDWYIVAVVLGIPLGLLGGLMKGSATGIRKVPAYLIPLGAFGEALLRADVFFDRSYPILDISGEIAEAVTIVVLILVALIGAFFVYRYYKSEAPEN